MSESRREHWILAGELWLTLLAAGVLFPVLLDLWATGFSELAARMEHGLALSLVWPLEQARATGLLPEEPSPRSLAAGLAVCALLAGAATAVAGLLDPPVGERPSRLRRLLALPWMLVVGLPALLLALAVLFLGLALDPLVFVTLCASGAIGGLLGRRRRRTPLLWERSLSGLPPVTWKTDHVVRYFLLFGLLSVLVLAAMASSLPLDQAPLQLALAIDAGTGVTGPGVLPWIFGLTVVLLLLLAPHSRRALGLMSWEPWLAGLSGAVGGALLLAALRDGAAARALVPMGFALGVFGALIAGAGVPWLPRLSPHPLRAVGRLGLPLAAALGAVFHVLTTGFFGCDEILDSPGITSLAREPAATSLAYTGGTDPAVFAAFAEPGFVLRLALDGKSTFVVEASTLPLAKVQQPGASVRPRLLGLGPGGRIFLVADLSSSQEEGTVLVELDAARADVIAGAISPGPCSSQSWSWNPILTVGVVGCGSSGELLLYQPDLQDFIARETLRGVVEVQSLALDPRDGAILTLARRKSPFVLRVDLQERRKLAWKFLGMSNLSLTLDSHGTLQVARFLGRQVLSLDPVDLTPVRARPAGFALGPLSSAPRHDRVLTASLVDGHLYAVDASGRRPTQRLKVGGAVRSLALSSDQRTLFASGMCGVFSVDLDPWLGRGDVPPSRL